MKRGAQVTARCYAPAPRSPHPAEVHNRETKAWTIVAALRDAGVTADDAARMTDDAWMAATRLAEATRAKQFSRVGKPGPVVRLPSDKTRRLVVQMLARSAAPAALDPAEAR